MDERDGTTPVALARDAPVAQAILGALAAESAFFQGGGDCVNCGLEREAGELPGVDGEAVFGVGRIPGRLHTLVGPCHGAHHGRDAQVVLRRELEVALVVGGHAHDRALAVAHEHVVGDPDPDGLCGEGVQHVQPRVQALLLLGGGIGFHHAAAAAFVDEGRKPGVAGGGGERDRVLGGDGEKGGAEQRVRPRGEHLQRPVRGHRLAGIGGVGEGDFAALAAADPVGLHDLHPLRPPRELLKIAEELVGVAGDVQVIHRDLALFHESPRAPAPPLDHLLVGEHGLVDGIPVHDPRPAVGDALFQHAQEQPLVPPVITRVAGGELTAPIDAEAERLQLRAHIFDVLTGPARGRHTVADGGVLGRQAERDPAHGLQHVTALHAHEAGQYVADGIIAHMPHVQPPRWVGQHGQAIEFLPSRVLAHLEGAMPFPVLLRGALDGGRIVDLVHQESAWNL